METASSRFKWINVLAILLVLPAAWFFCISLLKYSFGISGPYDFSAPLLERLGIQHSLGWNINLLILFGPLIALLISIWQVIHFELYSAKDRFDIRVTFFKKLVPLAILLFSGVTLATLFAYLLSENL